MGVASDQEYPRWQIWLKRRHQLEKNIYEAGPERAADYARRKSPQSAVRLLVIGMAFQDTDWCQKFLQKYLEPD